MNFLVKAEKKDIKYLEAIIPWSCFERCGKIELFELGGSNYEAFNSLSDLLTAYPSLNRENNLFLRIDVGTGIITNWPINKICDFYQNPIKVGCNGVYTLKDKNDVVIHEDVSYNPPCLGDYAGEYLEFTVGSDKRIAQWKFQQVDVDTILSRWYKEREKIVRAEKETEKEQLTSTKIQEKLFIDLLPVVDDFDRMVETMDTYSKDDIDAFKEGIRLVHRNLELFLEKYRVISIDTKGKKFNVDEHEAVGTVNTVEMNKGNVIKCILKGYTFKDKIIRFAKVIVGI